MADIELVIKISDEFYKRCKRECDEDESNGFIIDIVTLAIGNGTPLPKGHGRLIDADATIKEFGEWPDDWDKFAIGCLESADTIIEADKEED